MRCLICFLPLLLAAGEAEVAWPDFATPPHPAAENVPHATPASYPDAAGIRTRGAQIVRNLAREDLAKWRKGYFAGGDPGKYLPPAAMARLMLDPADPMALKYMNDNRSAKEHYHFAVVNWARFLPLFGDKLTPETRKLFAEQGWRHTSYYNGSGTENHKMMWFCAALVVPHYMEGKGLGRRDKQGVLKDRTKWIKAYTKGLYNAGMGEWESATYHMFSAHSLLNVYDFSPDPVARAWAAAALDYYIAAYALKYRDGTLGGPSQRGMATVATKKITDQSGWVWWGSSYAPTDAECANMRYAVHAATANWRPNRVLTRIARKELPDLPADYRNSKANYWLGLNQEPKPNVTQESYHVARTFSLGSLWSGWDRHGQTVRWQLTVDTDQGGVGLTGGHPWGLRYFDGQGKYEQTAQCGPTLVLLYRQPDEAELKEQLADDHAKELARLQGYVSFNLPPGVTPQLVDGWWVMQVGKTWIGLYPLGGEAAIAESTPTPRQVKRAKKKGVEAKGHPILKIDTPRGGFVLQCGEDGGSTRYADVAAFVSACNAGEIHYDAEKMSLEMLTIAGRFLKVGYRVGESKAAVTIDDEPVTFDDWPVFGGPHVHLAKGVLRCWDGEKGYQVDVTGDEPVWSDWAPAD